MSVCDKEFQGSVVWVTGSSRGIGEAVARRFAQKGAQLILHYVSQEALVTRVSESVVEAGGLQPLCLRCDVRSEEQIKGAVAEIKDRFGKISVLVNNVGISVDGLLPRYSLEDMNQVWEVNLRSNLLMCKHAFGLLRRGAPSAIVNMTSIVGLRGNVGQSVYAAAKAGIVALTQSLAREYASRGIRVNAVAPGFVETDMTGGLTQEVRDSYASKIPLGRFATPDDVAGCCCFLASASAGYMTGHTMVVDGGLSLV